MKKSNLSDELQQAHQRLNEAIQTLNGTRVQSASIHKAMIELARLTEKYVDKHGVLNGEELEKRLHQLVKLTEKHKCWVEAEKLALQRIEEARKWIVKAQKNLDGQQ